MKFLGTIFGYNLLLDTDDEDVEKQVNKFLAKLTEDCPVCKRRDEELLNKLTTK